METAIGESDGFLNESNWQDGFGWIGIDLRCVQCGHAHPEWAGGETGELILGITAKAASTIFYH